MAIFTRKLAIDDINYFDKKRKSSSKATNDCDNKIREQILYEMVKDTVPYKWYLGVPEWQKIKMRFLQSLKNISNCDYNKIDIEYKAGRKFNYDFTVQYLNKDNEIINEINIEFKFNCKKITNYPQFLAVSCKHFIKELDYAEYFYDNHLNSVINLININEIPSKKDYMKFIYQIDYDKLNIFKELYKNESKIKDLKKKIVDTSIKQYLTSVVNLDIEEINKTFETKQTNKTYIMYNDGLFYEDTISKEELTVIGIEKINKNNCLILNTNSSSKIHMLLRWKNHAGILYPAWQISIKRF
jgi:hypothetical protein